MHRQTTTTTHRRLLVPRQTTPATSTTDRAFPYELDPVARVVDVVGKAEVVDEQGVLHEGERRPDQEDHEHVQVDHVALAVQTSAATTSNTTHIRTHTRTHIRTHIRTHQRTHHTNTVTKIPSTSYTARFATA